MPYDEMLCHHALGAAGAGERHTLAARELAERLGVALAGRGRLTAEPLPSAPAAQQVVQDAMLRAVAQTRIAASFMTFIATPVGFRGTTQQQTDGRER